MKANVYDRSIYITEPETIVARSVEEYTVQFEFSEAWDGYATVAVFKTHDGTLKEVITVDGEAVIPWEVLTEPGVLYIGVYGTKTGKFRPTVWSEPQTIYDGAEEGDPAADPETTPWQQAVEQISEDVATAQAAAEASQTAAAAGPKIVNNTWYVWDSEEEAYVSTGVSATEPGPEGYSPSVEITKSGKRTTITITDKTGPHVATILDGEDGSGSGGNGDMTKAIYDTNNDGTVDSADVATNATKLGNQLPAYYAKATDIPTVPTNVSAFTNDAGYITSAPTKTSDLTNDSGFITSAALPTDVSDLNNDAGYVTQQDIGALMPLPVTMGGTGAATAAAARTNLGLAELIDHDGDATITWLSAADTYVDGTTRNCRFYRRGKLCLVNMNIRLKSGAFTSSVTIGTIPEGYRPLFISRGIWLISPYSESAVATNSRVQFAFETGGNFTMMHADGTAGFVRGILVYVLE
jgi:hypothetical protein